MSNVISIDKNKQADKAEDLTAFGDEVRQAIANYDGVLCAASIIGVLDIAKYNYLRSLEEID